MTWLFVALWKLPASSSLTRTAAARECVYGSVGGTKRPRSEFSPESQLIGLFRKSASGLARLLPKRHTGTYSKLLSACPFADSALPEGLGSRLAGIPRAGKCATGNRRR